MPWSKASQALHCSFCNKSQDVVAKLISSPDPPHVYICDECIAVCTTILEDSEAPPGVPGPKPVFAKHPLSSHPLASQFFTAVENWIARESGGEDSSQELAEMRKIAARMLPK